ncbi:MAG: tail fiber domain-containing protein [Candidatus Pacebacteria bacterium]|nr:tail fiber domain-containing protein [Candidatus Paceibacterota bacterium]MCF7857097.1 tail fiber domain-containing protein [Candidatus Paceibacterota bacterium]
MYLRRQHFLVCALLSCILVFAPVSHTQAFSLDDSSLWRGTATLFAGVSSFTCGSFFSYILNPLGLCATPNFDGEPLAQNDTLHDAMEGIVPDETPTTIPIAPTYITNTYNTNPTTIVRDTVREVVYHTESNTPPDLSQFVTRDFVNKQSNRIYDVQGDAQSTNAASFTTNLLTVSGDSTVSGLLTVDGALSSLAYTSAPYLTATDAAATSTFAGSVTVDGRVGIGTTSPKQKLHIVGNAYTETLIESLTADSALALKYASGNTGGMFFYSGATAAGSLYGGNDNSLNLQTYTASPLKFLTSGTERMRISDTGNVGIGIASPNTRFQIVNGSVSGNDAFAQFGSTVGGTGELGLQFGRSGATSGSLIIQGVKEGTGANNLSLQPSGGNIGIGTTSPTSKLTVNGDIRIETGSGGQLIFADGSTMSSAALGSAAALSNITDAIITGDSDTNSSGNILFKTGSNDRMTILNNGNVGIGTVGPGTPLQVNHGGGADGTRQNVLTVSTAGSVTYGGYIGNRAVSANTHQGMFIEGGGSLTLGAKSYNIDFITGAGITASGDTNLRMRIDSSGNVGIGTTEPGLRLETKAAAAGLPATSGTSQTGIMRLSQGIGTGVVDFGFGGTAGYGWIQAVDSGNLATNYGLLLNPNGGNVGIGTTNPTQELTVYGAGNNSTEINIIEPDAVSESIINFGDSMSGTARYEGRISYNHTTNALNLSTNHLVSTPELTLKNGNVGIGVASPQAMLDIVGNDTILKVRDTRTTGGNATLQLQAEGQLAQLKFYYGDRFAIDNGGGTEWLTIKQNGNIGIGTTSPQAKLSVKGSGTGSGFLAQFTDSADSPKFTILDNGNVGIGTAIPGSKLTVQGGSSGAVDFAVMHSTGNAGLYFSTLASGSGRLVFANSASTIVNQIGISDNEYTYFNNGNVGIGTSTPSAKLDVVEGIIRISGTSDAFDQTLSIQNNVNKVLKLTVGSNGGGTAWYTQPNTGTLGVDTGMDLRFSAGAAERMRVTSAGNVGISTTSPSAKLDVWGNLKVGTSSTPTLFVDAASGNVGIGTNNPTGKIQIYDNTDALIQSTIVNDSAGTSAWSRVGAGASFSSTFVEHFSNSYSGTGARQTGSGNLTTSGSGGLSISTETASTPIRFYTSGLAASNERMRIDSAGNVGIGTTSPQGSLTINSGQFTVPVGSAGAPSITFNDDLNTGIYHNAADIMSFSAGGNTIFEFFNDTNGAISRVGLQLKGVTATGIPSLSFASDVDTGFSSPGVNIVSLITGGNERLRIDSAGNVGIGTTNPQRILDLSNTSGVFLRGDRTSGAGDALTIVGTGQAAVEGARMVINMENTTDASSNIQFYTHNGAALGERMRITQAGNVGIGTTSPSGLLHVQKDQNSPTRIQITNENTGASSQTGLMVTNSALPNYYYTAGLMGTNFSTNGLFEPNKGVISVGGEIDGLNIFTQKSTAPLIFGTNGAEKMRISNTGNVGIGTTSPTSRLDIKQSVDAFGGGIRLNQVADSDYAEIVSAGDRLVFGLNGYERISILENGNVGIGTTSPTYKLEVAGTIASESSGAYNLGAAGRDWGCLYYNSGTLGTCASDERLKENIKTLTFTNGTSTALNKVANLELHTFNFKNAPGSTYKGLIAQEALTVAPELVELGSDGYYRVKYGDIQWLVLEALKELYGKVQALQDKFVDGVLTLTSANVDYVQSREICLSDDTGTSCIDRQKLQRLLEGDDALNNSDQDNVSTSQDPEPTTDTVDDDTTNTASSSAQANTTTEVTTQDDENSDISQEQTPTESDVITTPTEEEVPLSESTVENPTTTEPEVTTPTETSPTQ